jgi:hypothetical protein
MVILLGRRPACDRLDVGHGRRLSGVIKCHWRYGLEKSRGPMQYGSHLVATDRRKPVKEPFDVFPAFEDVK